MKVVVKNSKVSRAYQDSAMHCSFPCYGNERLGLDGWFGLSTESKNLLTFYYPCFDSLELYSESKSVSLRMYHVNLSQTINLGLSV